MDLTFAQANGVRFQVINFPEARNGSVKTYWNGYFLLNGNIFSILEFIKFIFYQAYIK